MTLPVSYPHDSTTGLPLPLSAEAVWGVASQLRAIVARQQTPWALNSRALIAAASALDVNGRRITATWDVVSPVRDDSGRDVLGICETDPQLPGMALVSVNGSMVAGQPELELSTIAHEIAHIVFDVPGTVDQPSRRYRSVTSGLDCLSRAEARSERRANEFMGALLVPPQPLHLRLVQAARAERLRMVHAPHRGRPGLRVLAEDTPAEALAGLTAVLAGDFGVSDRFIAVRLRRYRLVAGEAR
jgi:hypothetical protein